LCQVEVISNEVGGEDAGFVSRLCCRQVPLMSAQYRQRFGAMRHVLQSAGTASACMWGSTEETSNVGASREPQKQRRRLQAPSSRSIAY